jgi:hypothetical protein
MVMVSGLIDIVLLGGSIAAAVLVILVVLIWNCGGSGGAARPVVAVATLLPEWSGALCWRGLKHMCAPSKLCDRTKLPMVAVAHTTITPK